jgi:hypothetical protein
MKLNLSANPAPSNARSYQEEADPHAKVTLSLSFSNGAAATTLVASAGDTVAQIKKRISEAQGIAYGALSLVVAGKPLMDPLSLNDIKDVRGKTEVAVEVRVKS